MRTHFWCFNVDLYISWTYTPYPVSKSDTLGSITQSSLPGHSNTDANKHRLFDIKLENSTHRRRYQGLDIVERSGKQLSSASPYDTLYSRINAINSAGLFSDNSLVIPRVIYHHALRAGFEEEISLGSAATDHAPA